MKTTPTDWPRLSVSLVYRDPIAAIDWLCRAFGFEVRIKVLDKNGRLEHSELTFGEAVVMVSGEGDEAQRAGTGHRNSPRSLGGANTAGVMLYVDDADAHCARARAAGANIGIEPRTTDYGADYWSDRSYQAEDLDGHRWWFSQRMRSKGD